jgi:hypothetical protein
VALHLLRHRHPIGQHAYLDARHRSHARVEDRIRTGKDTGLGRMPSRQFAINAAWLACALTAIEIQSAQTPQLDVSNSELESPSALPGCAAGRGSLWRAHSGLQAWISAPRSD